MWSGLSAHLQPFFSTHYAYLNNFRQKIPYFDAAPQRRVLFNCFATKQCLGMQKMALSGSLWLPLWLSLALTDTLWPSLAHYCSLISRIQPLIGSQGPCLALIADATQTWDLSKNLHDRRFQGKKFTQKARNFRHLLNRDKKCVNALNWDKTSKKCSVTM